MKRFLIALLALLMLSTAADSRMHGGGGYSPGYVGPLRWVTTRGYLHTQTLTASGGKTRFMGHFYYSIGNCPAQSLQLVWSNFYQNPASNPNQEIQNPDVVTLSAVAVVYNGVNVPVKFSGSATVTVASGAADFHSDNFEASAFGAGPYFPSGAMLDVRWEGDIASGTSYVPVGSNVNLGPNDQEFWFTPANDNPQVPNQGAMTPPTGSSSPAIYAPDGVIGKFIGKCNAILNIGDSIFDGGDDTNGIGLNGLSLGTAGNINGGSYSRRVPTALGYAFLNMTRGGNEWIFFASQFSLRQNYFKYFTQAIEELGVNDPNPTSNIIAANCTVTQSLNAAGVQAIYQTTLTPKKEGTDNYHQTDLINQVDNPSYDTRAAILNGPSGFAANVGSTCHLTGIIDVASAVADSGTPTDWAVLPFSSTTAASITAGATSASLNAAPGIGHTLVFDPGMATADMDNYVISVIGSGPYTVGFSGAFSNNHSSGATVLETGSYDGIHSTGPDHIATGNVLYSVESAFTSAN